MVKGTHDNIVNAFFRVASQYPTRENITLSEVATEAGVSRQAIYAKHFSSVEDIKSEIYQSIDDSIYDNFKNTLEKYNGKKDISEIIADSLIPEIYAKRDWIRILYNTHTNAQWETFLEERYINLFLDYYADRIKANTFLSLEESVKIICNFILSLFSIWLSSDFPDPPEEFKKKFIPTLKSVQMIFISNE